MSVAYYIVLDREVGFDPFINGKSLAKEARRLNEVRPHAGPQAHRRLRDL